ncbi:MAG: hypothetical protein WD342_10560 [Verrucomicrobiales bacterium]
MSSPRRFAALLLWLGSFPLLATVSTGQESLADLEPFRRGCQALDDDRFESAADHLEEAWLVLTVGDAGDIEKNLVASRLLQALVRNGDSADAVARFAGDPGFRPSTETTYWMAKAFQEQERFAEAAEFYEALLSSKPNRSDTLVVNRAVCLARSGDEEAAFDLVRDRKPRNPNEALAFARIALGAGEFSTALDILDSTGDGMEGEPPLAFPAAILRVRVLSELNRTNEAVSETVELIDAASTEDEVRQSFFLLEQAAGDPEAPPLTEELNRWQADPDGFKAQAAEYYEVVLAAEPDELPSALKRFLDDAGDHRFALEARLRLAEHPENGGGDPLPAWDKDVPMESRLAEQLDFSRAAAKYRSALFEEASEAFLSLAERQTGEKQALNLYNAALAALRGDDETTFAIVEEKLSETAPRPPFLADLKYLGGLFFAAKGDPKALTRLTSFVRDYPDHSANVEAQLAVAEIHLNQAPARPQAAREIFEGLRVRPLTLAQSERLDYSAVWAEAIDNDAAALVKRGEDFITDWPNSAYLPEVTMLVAGQLYALKNLEAAREKFSSLAKESPDSPHRELADFFAAKSSSPDADTIGAWRRIIDAGGTLSAAARHELGLLHLSLDRFADARKVFAALAESEDDLANLRYAAIADLGFSWYAEALSRENDPELLARAADVYARLSNTSEAPRFWRYSAAVRRGKCLETLGKPFVALEIYRSIVNEQATSTTGLGTTSTRETDWIFRAGFAAIEILKKEEDWAGAIRLADALALKDGPRAIEAARLAERLRLEHWVWE